MTNDGKRSSPRRQDETRDRNCGSLLGLAAGDAVGTTVEFYGESGMPPEWMETLCIADAIRGFADRLCNTAELGCGRIRAGSAAMLLA